ncbi:MAG: hypothetical protein QW423_01165 [Candidatus Aenigmatarchaeota archaeon]
MYEYLKWSILYHLDSIEKIKPVLDYEIKLKNKSCDIFNFVILYLMNDFDKTLTTENSLTVFEEFYFNQLPIVNKNINKNLHKIEKCIKDIERSPQNFSKLHENLDEILRKCELTKNQFIEACIETGKSKNIKIVPYAAEAISDLENMNCVVGINSGSPKLAIEEISRRRIGIENENIAATEFYFDKNNRFLNSWLNLSENKAKSMGYYFFPRTYCNLSLLTDFNRPNIFYITDDLSPFEQPLVAKVGSELGAVLFVGEDLEKFVVKNEYVVNAPELRKDFRKIKPYLTLYRRSKIFPFLHKPEEAEEIIRLAERINLSNYKNPENILDNIEEFISLEFLFPSLTTRIEEKCRKLRRKLKEGNLKKEELKEIVKIMKTFDPAFHIKKKRKKELEEIIFSLSSL